VRRTIDYRTPATTAQGKTTVTATLAHYYRQQSQPVRVCKTGLDFLDPLILAQTSDQPVYQLHAIVQRRAQA